MHPDRNHPEEDRLCLHKLLGICLAERVFLLDLFPVLQEIVFLTKDFSLSRGVRR